jgi:hypothetical protein
MNNPVDNKQPENLSLVLGGPLFQLLLRTRLSTDTLGLVKRRVIVFSSFTWMPLLLLSFFPGESAGGDIKVPFLYDFEVHTRFLLSLPLLLVAELVIHQRFRPIVQQFVKRGIVSPEILPKFQDSIDSALRLRNSVLIEVLLIILVFTAGHYLWLNQATIQTSTWVSVFLDGQRHLSPAGFWYVYVSIPVFQFLLYRWLFRIFIWARFLWQVSRLDLHLVPTHPDRAGGLGFLAESVTAFVPLLMGLGVLLAGLIANKIFYEGLTLLSFKQEIIATVVFALLFTLGPLCVFASKLAHTKRQGSLEYGALASNYVQEFDRKWLRDAPPQDERLVGSSDIQSLNDLAGSFSVVQGMRLFPFDKAAVMQAAVVTLLPVLPLALTMISMEELIKTLLGILL